MVLKNPDTPQDRDGYRLSVYSRQFDGTVWDLPHKFDTDRIFIEVFDLNFNTIFPDEIQKVDNENVRITFTQPTEGHASIFRTSPLLNGQRANFENQTEFIIEHKFRSKNYLCQFWNSENYMFFPKTLEKINNNALRVEFFESATGYVDLIRGFPRAKKIVRDSVEWIYRHGYKQSRNHILVQCTDDDNFVFMPTEISRIDTINNFTTDNVIEIQLTTEDKGEINSIIHGFRI